MNGPDNEGEVKCERSRTLTLSRPGLVKEGQDPKRNRK